MHLVNLTAAFGPEPLEICRELQRRGHDAVIVGGPVRDHLARSTPKDVDLATSATPDEIKALPWRTFSQGNGERHGTVGVLAPSGEVYEVTTFRFDVETDGRHAQVRFTESLDEDLQRRDFTINAMAIRPDPGLDSGTLIDPYGGLRDMEHGVLRAVGDADVRFQEDYLRILRGYRFGARFGLEIHPGTRAAMRRNAAGLQGVSRERFRDEIMKMMAQTTRHGELARALAMMQLDGAMAVILPEVASTVDCLQNEWHAYDVFNHLIAVADSAPASRPLMRFAGLVHDIGKPATRDVVDGRVRFFTHEEVGAEMVEALMLRLAFPGQERRWVVELVRSHMRLATPSVSERMFLRLRRKLEQGVTLSDLIDFRLYDKAGSGIEAAQMTPDEERGLRALAAAAEAHQTPVRTSGLPVSGRDVMEVLGIGPGPEVGSTLRRLLDLVTEDPGMGTRERLMGALEASRDSREGSGRSIP